VRLLLEKKKKKGGGKNLRGTAEKTLPSSDMASLKVTGLGKGKERRGGEEGGRKHSEDCRPLISRRKRKGKKRKGGPWTSEKVLLVPYRVGEKEKKKKRKKN